MSSQTIALENPHLTLALDELELNVASTVNLRFQPGWNLPHDVNILAKALKSGHIWVSRGRRCRVDVQVSFHGETLERAPRINISESLGRHLRDAHLWSQLSLSTALEIPSAQVADSAADFSIYLNHEISTADTQSKARLIDSIDFKAPESVLCAEFESLLIRMEFKKLRNNSRNSSKRLKPSALESGSAEQMLLDYVSKVEGDAELTSFENVVVALRDKLSKSIAKCFDNSIANGSEDSPRILHESLLTLNNTVSLPQSSTVSAERAVFNGSVTKPRRNESYHSREEIRDTLGALFTAHPYNSHSNNKENLELMQSTDLQKSMFCSPNSLSEYLLTKFLLEKVNNWIHYSPSCLSRNTSSIASVKSKESVIKQYELRQPSRIPYESDEDEMLLSHTTSSEPSLISQSSTISSYSSSTPLKRPANDSVVCFIVTSALTQTLPKSANKLASVALSTLIARPSNWKRNLEGINFVGPPVSFPLTNIVPSMFCPGFREIIAHNAKLLPTISNAVCLSWLTNVQGVGLRQKLTGLSNVKKSKYHEGRGEEGSVERLVAVVQGRMWRMMQRTLYDEGSARKLWRKDLDYETDNISLNGDSYDDEDLLDEIYERQQSVDMETGSLKEFAGDKFLDDDEDLFYDLLNGMEECGSDDGILNHLEEQEKLAIEAETDEMLFGSDCFQSAYKGILYGAVDDEPMLLEGDSQEEDMLL